MKKIMKNRKVLYYEHNGWSIFSEGGFITIKRFSAIKGELHHWAFTLKECIILCDKRNAGERIGTLYLKPLYQ